MTKEAINELKKYALGRKNTEKVEISVLQLNRVIKALEQEPCDKCEVGNPCLYCKHEFEPQESEEEYGNNKTTSNMGF